MVMFFSGISNLFYVAKKFHFSLDLFPILQEIDHLNYCRPENIYGFLC
jgi:hypothetical protein